MDVRNNIKMDDIHLTVLQDFLEGGELGFVNATIDLVDFVGLEIFEGLLWSGESG